MPVANRRAFMRELSRLMALAKRYDSASSIIYIDLNGMKVVNDRYGHNVGDAALQHVARILIENTRHADIVARLGGDEFGVLLVKTDQHNAEEKATSLSHAIEQHPLIWDDTPIRLSAAFGAYCFTGLESVAEAISAADQAMYRAKQARQSEPNGPMASRRSLKRSGERRRARVIARLQGVQHAIRQARYALCHAAQENEAVLIRDDAERADDSPASARCRAIAAASAGPRFDRAGRARKRLPEARRDGDRRAARPERKLRPVTAARSGRHRPRRSASL